MESEYRSDCICRTLHQDIPSSREIRQKESTLNVSRGSTNGKPCSEAQEQEPDNGIKDNAESSKENPESAGIRFPVIALGTRCREVMKIIDVAVRNQDPISPVLVRKADRNDMVHLHRLFQHDAPAIRTEIILAHESGMGSNVLIAVVVRPLIFRFLGHGYHLQEVDFVQGCSGGLRRVGNPSGRWSGNFNPSACVPLFSFSHSCTQAENSMPCVCSQIERSP